jgi:hypothetical protein
LPKQRRRSPGHARKVNPNATTDEEFNLKEEAARSLLLLP